MWFTRSVDGCRCWFIVDVLGELRTGLAAADFTMTVINPTDTATTSPTVSQSTQKPGLYFADIPSSFLIANGMGHYAIIVEVNTVTGVSEPPEVVATMSAFLQVSQEDFDSLEIGITALAGAGLTATQATMLLEMYRLLGLDPTKPLVVTAANRSVTGASISQTIDEASGTVTVTRI